MRKTKNIPWQGTDLTVQELTMAELAETLDSAPQTADQLDLVFDGRLPSEAVVKSSGLKREELHKLPPSQLDLLWSAVEEVNPFFLKAVQHVLTLGSKVLAQHSST